MPDDYTLEAAVAKGVSLLDMKLPTWRRGIDLDALDMSSCFSCVLGQTWGFTEGTRRLDIVGRAVEYGFDLPPDNADASDDFTEYNYEVELDRQAAWKELNDLWVEAIREGTEQS